MSNNIINHNNLQPNETTFLLPSGNIKVREYNSRVELKELNKEVFLILKRALPVVLAYLLQQAIPLVSLSSLGHMRSEYLSASALANMFAAVTGWSICNGLATALDTLCSQAFTGSGNPHLVGIYFQRGILLSILIFCPISLLWWYSYDLLIYLNIDEELSLL
ncbi:mate-domain-containing protein, partial [Conidiobolus coronatus NRRL 28638]